MRVMLRELAQSARIERSAHGEAARMEGGAGQGRGEGSGRVEQAVQGVQDEDGAGTRQIAPR